MSVSPASIRADQPMLAAAWMIGAITAFTTMAVAGRAVTLAHDTFEIMLFRSIAGFGIVLIVAGAAGTLGQVTRRHMGLHLIRNISHFTGQNLWFFALGLIPLAPLFALEFTTPIWVALLAPLVLGERLTPIRMLAVALGFVGVLFVVRPDPATLNAGAIAAAASAIGFAGSILATRRLTRTETITCILFWLTLIQMVLGLICAGYDLQIKAPTLETLPWLGLIAVAGLTAHLCLTMALSHAPASFVMPIDFARLPLVAIIGMLFYAEPLDLWILTGAGVILVANWINIRAQTAG